MHGKQLKSYFTNSYKNERWTLLTQKNHGFYGNHLGKLKTWGLIWKMIQWGIKKKEMGISESIMAAEIHNGGKKNKIKC